MFSQKIIYAYIHSFLSSGDVRTLKMYLMDYLKKYPQDREKMLSLLIEVQKELQKSSSK
jgi:hypothetical protein